MCNNGPEAVFVVSIMLESRIVTSFPTIELDSASKAFGVVGTGAGRMKVEAGFGKLCLSAKHIQHDQLTSSGEGD
jgi:hypothetical protein